MAKPWNEQLHPRGFGGKFGQGTGSKKTPPAKDAKTPTKKYTPGGVPSGARMKRPPTVGNSRKPSPAPQAKPKPLPPAIANTPLPEAMPSTPPKPAPKPSAPKAAKAVPKLATAPKPMRDTAPGPVNQMLAVGRRPDGTIDFDVRAKYVDEQLIGWRYQKNPDGSVGFDTQSLYRDENGEWTPERKAQQDQLMDDIWQMHAAHVPNEGRAIFSGGLGGAGKGYALGKEQLNVDTDADWEHPGKAHEFFTINPDTVKVMMAHRGMIPLDVDPNMTPMELSPLAHEEASDIADVLARRAYREKKNIIWDFTMSTEGSVVRKRLEPMREAGYDQITALFVDTTVKRSVEQATKRWKRGMNDFIGGQGYGGRFLPSTATKENAPTGDKFRSKNRETFEAVKDKFDGYVEMENVDNGMTPIARSGIPVGGKPPGKR